MGGCIFCRGKGASGLTVGGVWLIVRRGDPQI